MGEIQKITDFKDQLGKEYKPSKVILFGSYASGAPTNDSDVDIFVILSFRGKNAIKSAEILDLTDLRFPIDLIVRTPEQIQERFGQGDFFIREIIDKGIGLFRE